MRNIKKIIVVLTISTLLLLSGCIGNKTDKNQSTGIKTIAETGKTSTEWCKAGSSITTTGGVQESSFTIRGMTKYKGNDVCEAETKSGGQVMTYYFTENNDVGYMLIKDSSGNIIQEININN